MKITPLEKIKELEEPDESLYRIQRGLTGYISYQAACDTNPTFTEYGLYEIIIRILMQRKYTTVNCEDPCEGLADKEEGSRGDDCKIDFTAFKGKMCFALEVKWPRSKRGKYSVKQDYDKLVHFHGRNPNAQLFFCVFGRYDHIKGIKPHPGKNAPPQDKFVERTFTSKKKPVYAFFGRTQYGCRIFELKRAAA